MMTWYWYDDGNGEMWWWWWWWWSCSWCWWCSLMEGRVVLRDERKEEGRGHLILRRGQSILSSNRTSHSITDFVSQWFQQSPLYLWYLEPTCRGVHHPTCALCDPFLPFLPPCWNCRPPRVRLRRHQGIRLHNHMNIWTHWHFHKIECNSTATHRRKKGIYSIPKHNLKYHIYGFLFNTRIFAIASSLTMSSTLGNLPPGDQWDRSALVIIAVHLH